MIFKYTKNNGMDYVSKDTGGISTFDRQRSTFGGFWWKIPKGTKIPSGLRVSMDFNPKPSVNPTHYTIRPLYDMPLMQYISLLEELALSAERMFDIANNNYAEGRSNES